MSRKNDGDSGSLELLLDTICNTFGGVIFIAILVVVLLQMTGKATPTQVDARSQAELIDAEETLREAQAKLERLTTAAASVPLENMTDPKLLQQIKAMRQAEAERDRRMRQQSEILGEIAARQIDINAVMREKERIDQEHAAVARELAALQQNLSQEEAARSKTAKLPKIRESSKGQMAMILQAGKAFFVTLPTGAGYNTAECEPQKLPNGQSQIVPKQGAGLAIDVASRTAFEGRLKQFDPTTHFMSVFVWPDSFDQFAIVRDVLVKQGFEYHLVPFPSSQMGVPITSGSRKGGMHVQ